MKFKVAERNPVSWIVHSGQHAGPLVRGLQEQLGSEQLPQPSEPRDAIRGLLFG
jgi:hypothetical protein